MMDREEEAEKKEICEKYSAKSAAEPDNANAYYISTRCITDKALSKQRYLEGVQKWPNHGWMNYAASFFYSKQGSWQKAYDALQVSYNNNADLQPIIGTNVERIKRYIESQGKTVSNAKRLDSEILDYYESIESGKTENNYDKVYYLISKGNLKGALDLAKTLPDISKNIIAICGASDGASDDMIKQALAVEPDSLSSDIATFSAVGLPVSYTHLTLPTIYSV